ncbi:extracellular solute-binding protein [Bacillus sp. AK128]
MKKLFSIFLLVLMSFALVACNSTVSTKTETSNSNGSNQTTTEKEEETKEPVELTMYYPVAVGGPITELIDKMATDFNKENPHITVKPVYTGSYADTMVKAQTAFKGGTPPDLAVLSSTDLFTLLDMDMIESFDDKVEQEYIDDFYYGFLENGLANDKLWSIPFARSTQILYYNKDAFKEAGLDPEKAPQNWDEVIEYSKALTKDGQWGIEVPATGYGAWLFQGFALQNGKNLMNTDGTEVYFDTPENVEALQLWLDLSKKHKVMPEGLVDWATTPSDFLEGKTAMMIHTTGNLANIRDNATFEFGTAYLPAGKKGHGTPVGGGNLFMFKGMGEEKQQAAIEFIQYVTKPEITAQWSIDTGYIATRKSAYEVDTMKTYLEEFPQAAIARDQLEYASASISTHNNGEVQKILQDQIQAVLTGELTPAEALKKAQDMATELLVPFN